MGKRKKEHWCQLVIVSSCSASCSLLQSAHTLQTTFNELNIQVGKDYVYAHEGDVYNCVVFTDIRRIHPDEVFSKLPLILC